MLGYKKEAPLGILQAGKLSFLCNIISNMFTKVKFFVNNEVYFAHIDRYFL